MTTSTPRFRDLLPSARGALRRFSLASIMPVLAFYAAFRLFGPAWGIATGMAFSLLALLIQLRRLKRLDPVVILPMIVILINGSIALAVDSVEIYLAAPAVENALWGLALTGSVLIRRPLVHVIARELGLIPMAQSHSPVVRRALVQLTLAWGLAAFSKSLVRLWLLATLSLEPFLVAVTVYHTVLNGCMLAFSFWWPLRALRAAKAQTGDGGGISDKWCSGE